jgi:hypothetical protein
MQEKESSDTEKTNVWGAVRDVIIEILKPEIDTPPGKCNLIATILIFSIMAIQAGKKPFDLNEYSFMILVLGFLILSLMISARSDRFKEVSELRKEF